jgi:flagellar biosynthesis protein FlhA
MVLLLLPGMPKWPILLMVGLLGLSWWTSRRARSADAEQEELIDIPTDPQAQTAHDGIEVLLGAELVAAFADKRALLLERIAMVRKAHFVEFGTPLPPVRIMDGDGTGFNDFEIRIFGVRFGMVTLVPDRLLAVANDDQNRRLAGIEAHDVLPGRSGFWIEAGQADDARRQGFVVVDPIAVMMTQFADVVRGEAARLLSRPVVIEMIDGLRQRQPSLVEDLVPTMLSVAEVQRILRSLLSEGVSIANLDLIFECLVDLARGQREPDELSELLRQRIGFAICNQLRGRHRDLAVMSLDPRLENDLSGKLGNVTKGLMDPRVADGLVRGLKPIAERMHKDGRAPVLLCGVEIRRAIKALTSRTIPRLSVISVQEIPDRIDLTSYDIVKVDA